MDSYEKIFDLRGASYHKAMQEFPSARQEEFEITSSFLRQSPGSTILDLPAGDGYLRRYLSKDIDYLAYDFSGTFDDAHAGIRKCKESKIEIGSSKIDEVVSLAAFHHVVQREAFILEMNRVLKTGGQLIIGDVLKESRVDSFLNCFVNQWNSLGHHGKFLDPHEDILFIESHGFSVSFEQRELNWNFDREQDAIAFVRKLFFLDKNPSDHLILEELDKLGVRSSIDGFKVCWSLGFYSAIKL